MTALTPGVARAAIVTGASRGLGAAISRRLGADGWAVAVNYRSGVEQAQAVAASIRAAGGLAEAIATAVAQLGPVGLIVANATGPQPETRLEGLRWQTYVDQFEFFVKSPTLLVQAALPSMRSLGFGRVVLIGSDMVDRALPNWSAYIAAKSAQLGLTKVWAKELGQDSITVNLVAPGWIPVERHGDVDRSSYVAEVPLRRIGVPDDIAGMVAYLASDAASFVTGQRITVNGGHVLS
jgi:3-oxoacyl-[acyl-carrier protein] reductase